MLRKRFLSIGVLMMVLTALCLVFTKPAYSGLETQLLVDVSPSTDYVPYLQTQWYGFTAIGGKGYCAILAPSTGNSNLYLFDTDFNRVGYSKNSGTTQDKVWYGQATSGPMHIACYGVANPSTNFTIRVITSPYVKTITPTSGNAGILLTLTGFGFGDTRGTNYVKFGSVTATNYSSWSNTQIKVYVPAGISAGVIQVVVYVASRPSNPTNFSLTGASSNGTMWRYDLGRTGNYPNGPTALPLNLKWSYNIGFPIYTSPVVANNIVYFGGDKLYALDANTGIFKWSYQPDGWVYSSPAIALGVVYFGASSGRFYALDANTGSLKWRFDGALFSNLENSPAVADNIVYFTAGKKLFALDATTGNLKWSYTVSGEYGIVSSPAIANGMVYLGDFPTSSYNGKIYALDSLTGAVKWIYTIINEFSNGIPAIVNGVLYVGTINVISDGGVIALDANTGSVKWHVGAHGSPETPAVANGVVYIHCTHDFYALDANTGNVKWDVLGTGSSTAPSFSKGIIYITNGAEGVLYAYDSNTGAVKWSYVIGGWSGSKSSPHIVNGRVYVGSSNGNVYCFGQ